MTLPLDTRPLRRAVVAALTTPTGQYRSLALDGLGLFKSLPPSKGQLRSAAVIDTPGVWVRLRNYDGAPTRPMDGGDRTRVAVTVEITVTYPSGNPSIEAEATKAVELADRDAMRIRAALTTSGALATDPFGNDTGADDSCLAPGGWDSPGPDPFPHDTKEPRVLRVVHAFRTTVELRLP